MSINNTVRYEPPMHEDYETRVRKKDYKDSELWKISGGRYFPSIAVTETLPSGLYSIGYDNHEGVFFKEQSIKIDELLILPDSASEKVIAEIEYFWTKEKEFRDLNFLWKRGIMLYGPPGSGKTSTIQLISKMIIEANGLTIYIEDPYYAKLALKVLRTIEPVRPIVMIFEDIDAMIEREGEADILSLLDGELQIDNVVFIATTNYIDKLDDRIKNRPSRFDIVAYIDFPSEEARREFLIKKNPRIANNPKELNTWVDGTRNFTIAHLKELIILVEIFGNSFEDSIERLNKMSHQETSTGSSSNESFGFNQPAKKKK